MLLLSRRNTGDEDGGYSVPAAPLDGGETVILATARDAREKLGIAIDPGELHAVGMMHRRSNGKRIDFFGKTAGWRGEPVNREPGKYDERRWVDPAAPPTNTIPYLHSRRPRQLATRRLVRQVRLVDRPAPLVGRSQSTALRYNPRPGIRPGVRSGGSDMAVAVGDLAPDFALYGASGNLVRLSDLRGRKRALLIFYPKDLTSG